MTRAPVFYRFVAFGLLPASRGSCAEPEKLRGDEQTEEGPRKGKTVKFTFLKWIAPVVARGVVTM